MRGSELENLRIKDARSTYKDDVRTITIHIPHSKTDQLGVGSFRTLCMTDLMLRPVTSTADYLTRIRWGSQSTEFSFSESMRGRLHDLAKLAASCNGLKTTRLGAHSLRSGGSTACYVAGVPLDDIRRFGRWGSCVSHRHIHHDEWMYHGLSRHIARTAGLLGQLSQTNSVNKSARAGESSGRTEFRTAGVATRSNERFGRFRTGGSTLFDSESDSGNMVSRYGVFSADTRSCESVFIMEEWGQSTTEISRRPQGLI